MRSNISTFGVEIFMGESTTTILNQGIKQLSLYKQKNTRCKGALF